MRNSTGTIKSLTSTFHAEIYEDAQAALRDYPAWELDRDYALMRLKHEGEFFVVNCLPLLGKAFDKSLITNQTIEVPKGFDLFGSTRLPVYLHSLFAMVLDDEGNPKSFTSEEHSDVANTIYWIRQITLAFSKVSDVECSQTEEEAFCLFRERVTRPPNILCPSWLMNDIRKNIASVVMDGEELAAPLAQWAEAPWGRHGPGAVSEGEKGSDKWHFREYPGLKPDLFEWRSSAFEFSEFSDSPPCSRATVVPKDFRSRRVICIEPKEYQFAQQGLMATLYDLIERHYITRKSISFRDQRPSQRLCKRLDLGTIDLKDASDTVSLTLCRAIFPEKFFRLVTRYRTPFLSIDDEIVKPTCFASMGSALCFPIETLVFWAIAQSVRAYYKDRAPLRVYGDDIIVGRSIAASVVHALELCGFTPNSSKTCIETPVRESCGEWMWNGVSCRIARFGTCSCVDLKSWYGLTEMLKQWCEVLPQTASTILHILTLFYPVPFGHLGFPPSATQKCRTRFNPLLQRREVRMPVLSTGQGRCALPGYQGLYAWQVGNDTRPCPSGTIKVKMGWLAV